MSRCESVLMDIMEKRVRCDVEALKKNLSPVSCDVKFLPWWASNYGMPFYNSEWTEKTQRDVVLRFRIIHKIRGSLAALKRLMDIFGVIVEVSEWFDSNPLSDPYTFDVGVFINDNDFGIGRKAEAQMRQIIDWVKPLSRKYNLTIKYRISARLVTVPVMGWAGYTKFSGDFRNV